MRKNFVEIYAGKIFIAIFTLFFTSCSLNRTYIVKDAYYGKEIKGKSLAIAPLMPKSQIENSIDVIQQIGDGDPAEVYEAYFIKNLIHYLKRNSFFKDVFVTQIDSSVELKSTKLALSDERKLNFLLPRDGKVLQTDSIKADFVLSIQNIIVSRGKVRAVPSLYGGAYPLPATPLQHGKFVFWDNIKGTVVSFGEFNEDNNLTKNAVHNIARAILYESPFENRKKNRISKMPR